MSFTRRLGDAVPYALILCAAVGLYYVADHISYAAIPDQMGPDRWPKIVISVLILVCGIELVRRLIARSDSVEPSSDPQELEADLMSHHQAHPGLVIGTVLATVGYLLVLDTLGFFISTIFYTGCLMALGGFRKPLVVSIMSLVLSFFFTFIFMKLIFVALPLGHGPFEKISLAVMNLVGVH
jgi:putative tricarboxylic transport membrane protein